MLNYRQLHHFVRNIIRAKSLRVQLFFSLIALSLAVGAGFFWAWGIYSHHETLRVLAEHDAEQAMLKLDEWRNVSGSKDIALNMANAELEWQQGEMKRLNEENAALLEELQLYRRVFSGGTAGDLMSIDSFVLSKAATKGVYRFRITLIQHGRSNRPIQGQLSLSLTGVRSEQLVKLQTWELLSAVDKASMSFSFRYLQTIEGILQIPGDISPEHIEIQATLDKAPKKKSQIFQTYSWQQLMQQVF